MMVWIVTSLDTDGVFLKIWLYLGQEMVKIIANIFKIGDGRKFCKTQFNSLFSVWFKIFRTNIIL